MVKIGQDKPGRGRNNSVSCLEIPFPVLKIKFETLGSNEKHFVNEVYWSGGLEVGGIIPFPVLKINFETLGTNENHYVKEVFWSEV